MLVVIVIMSKDNRLTELHDNIAKQVISVKLLA